MPGGFGEILVADDFDENNVCIGDLVRIGSAGSNATRGADGCVLEVSLPRQPCFKLNQRSGIKNSAPNTHQHSKTGWYYRIKEKEIIEAGMEMRVIQRDHPRWSISRLHHFLHRDPTNLEVAQELMNIKFIGDECRNLFEKRWQKELEKRMKKKEAGRLFRVADKVVEAPRIMCLELEAVQRCEKPVDIPFGSYAVVKFPNRLKRAYSIVGGNTDKLTLGVARNDNSRGVPAYTHEKLEPGTNLDVLTNDQGIKASGMAWYYIFIIGGIGVTAFLAMMDSVMAVNQVFELHYAVQTLDGVAFKPLIDSLGLFVRT